MPVLHNHAQTLIRTYAQQVHRVRKDYGDGIVDPVVDKFAWERVQKITPEQTGDPRWAEMGPRYVHLVILEEILTCNEARQGLKKKRKKSTPEEK